MNKRTRKSMTSSAKQDWGTPQELFDKLDQEYGFTLDVCANESNTKCAEFISPSLDGLIQPWDGICWCNPPFSELKPGNKKPTSCWGKWVKKAWDERKRGVKTVMLLPARTDTVAFHKWIYKVIGVKVEFLKGRIKFEGASDPALFPSMIVIMEPIKRSKQDEMLLEER